MNVKSTMTAEELAAWMANPLIGFATMEPVDRLSCEDCGKLLQYHAKRGLCIACIRQRGMEEFDCFVCGVHVRRHRNRFSCERKCCSPRCAGMLSRRMAQ